MKSQLTTTETAETRLVTKVRFIVEKQNSLLKNVLREAETLSQQFLMRLLCAIIQLKKV